jgi:hypothetical protein
MIRRSRTRTLIVTRSQTITSTGSGAIEPLFFDSAKGSRHPATSGAAPLKRSPRGWQMWWAPRKARGPWRSDPALRVPPGSGASRLLRALTTPMGRFVPRPEARDRLH